MLKKMNRAEKKAAKTADLPGGQNQYLGVKLRHTRMTKGMRLRDLAEKAECSESMLSKIENGHAVPSLKTLYRIAEAHGPDVGSYSISRRSRMAWCRAAANAPSCTQTRCATVPD